MRRACRPRTSAGSSSIARSARRNLAWTRCRPRRENLPRPARRARARRRARAAPTPPRAAPPRPRRRGTRGAARRAARAAGALLGNGGGAQSPPHPVCFHAPAPADAGILARQSEIEELEARCKALAQRAEAAAAEATGVEARLAARSEALEQARDTLASRQQGKHDAQIEALKLGQALERYQERTAQIRDEVGVIGADAARDGARLSE